MSDFDYLLDTVNSPLNLLGVIIALLAGSLIGAKVRKSIMFKFITGTMILGYIGLRVARTEDSQFLSRFLEEMLFISLIALVIRVIIELFSRKDKMQSDNQ